MNSTILTGIIGIVTMIVTNFCSWFFTKKKYNSEVDQTLISNMQKALEFYTNLSDDNKKRLDEITEQNTILINQVSILQKQVMDLTAFIKQEMGDDVDISDIISSDSLIDKD